ncbi:hypothetical protein V501_07353 [Pseudogymnoascus sp. VKM F-4519 (FW-2642)]|nr:hypothetical protein V501_07353 [Pseudogymnoascus sp. VKM F-4519 (FW-2642)]
MSPPPPTSETTPLLPSNSAPEPPPRETRSVTFNPTPSVATIPPTPMPMLSALNHRLRRRNSSGAPAGYSPSPLGPNPIPASKIGPQRTSKTAQKLKLLPNPDFGEEGPDEESGRDVYSQYTRIKDPTARRDAARLGKADRERLPRVTAYCTANRYRMDRLMQFLKGRGKGRGAAPRLFDECIYTPYNYGKGGVGGKTVRSAPVREAPAETMERRYSDSVVEVEGRQEDLISLAAADEDVPDALLPPPAAPHVIEEEDTPDFDTTVHVPEIFIFAYGVVVIWGMSVAHEQRFLGELARFEEEKLGRDDIEAECFNFYYTQEYQARVYNDFITLREKTNYMVKLAISHALAQSVKTSLFEELVDNTITTCQDIPASIARTGTIALSRKEINMQIGELFILRISIHLNGSVLDTPELFWVEPQLEPVYQAVRSYLEMDQRVQLLTERLDVIADLLAVLKEQLTSGHGEMLEWIVIVLIAAEIAVALVNIFVDLQAGVD